MAFRVTFTDADYHTSIHGRRSIRITITWGAETRHYYYQVDGWAQRHYMDYCNKWSRQVETDNLMQSRWVKTILLLSRVDGSKQLYY